MGYYKCIKVACSVDGEDAIKYNAVTVNNPEITFELIDDLDYWYCCSVLTLKEIALR